MPAEQRMSRWRAFRALLTAITMLLALPAAAQISVLSTSTASSSSPTSTLTLATPAGVVAGDVLVAQLAIRGGSGVGISGAPPGWILVNRTNSGTTVAQAAYLRFVTAAEPASHAWTFSSNRVSGAVVALRGVHTSAPVNAVAAQATTSASTSIIAPSVSTTVPETMLLGLYSAENGNGAFSPPSGMVERADIGSGAGPNGVTLAIASATRSAVGATGTRTATYSMARRGVGLLLALQPATVTPGLPGGFNAFEPATPSGAVTGVIKTRIAGAPFTLAVVALDAGGTTVATTFTGTVTVELIDASDNSGALDPASACRTSWSVIRKVAPDPSFAAADNGRINVSFSEPEAWRNVRVRVRHTGGTGTVTGCSADNFAIRPAAFAGVQALDADDGNAGLSRLLANALPSGGVVHRAGRPFSVLAQAISATGATTAGYSGAPLLSAAACTLPAGCAAGTLSAALVATGGMVSGQASYSEAGVIDAVLTDDQFAIVDLADSTAAERTIATGAVTFGRFVADRYLLAFASEPQFGSGLCAGGPAMQGFTFVGQPFAFSVVPVVLATPLNAAGDALANAQPRYTAAHVAHTVAAATAPAPFTGATAVASIAHAVASTITFSAGSFSFTRPAAPLASFAPALSMTINLADTTENTVAGNNTIAATAPLTIDPIVFAGGGNSFHYGRAQLRPSYGDVRRELYAPLEVQRYNGLGWIALPEAGACLVAPASAFAYANATGLLNAGGGAANCASRVAAPVTTANGRTAIRLDKPGPVSTAEPSAMTMTLNLLAAAAGSSCAGAAPTAATTIAAPWLASPDGSNPSARLTWGRSRGELLGLRERFD
jgi:hypothetical protein